MSARLRFVEKRDLLPRAVISRLLSRYVIEADADSWKSLDTGCTHHDYGPHNILVANRGICVIDLGDSRADFVLQDVARFWLDITVLATSRTFSSDRQFLYGLGDRFLSNLGFSATGNCFGFFATNIALALLMNARSRTHASPWQRWRRHIAESLTTWLTRHSMDGSFGEYTRVG